MRASRTTVAPAPPLIARVKALGAAADLAVGRSDEALVAEAKRVARQVDRRLAFSGEVTVVALAGATGCGKSSLFNAISGTQLARSGVRRPTTANSMAACWGPDVPVELLSWLDVPERHTVTGGDARFNGLVLLDMPDHDSTQLSHRDEVDRLVKLVDGLIWVVDPQKYADKALYERYLKPMAAYSDVMFVVLNQADRLTSDELKVALAHLRSVLDDAGLAKATLLATSALTGQGIDDLRAKVAALVASKRAAAQRLSVDVSRAAKGLAGDVSRNRRRVVSNESKQALSVALQQAAGLPQVVANVNQATRRQGAAATGWPVVSWVFKLLPNPLKGGVVKVPEVTGAVASAQVDGALRQLGSEVTVGLAPGWAASVKAAAVDKRNELPGLLDAAVAKVDLGVAKPMPWWRFIRVAQWVFIGVVVVGIAWAIIGAAAGLVAPAWHRLAWPLILILGGALVGIAVALICHGAVGLSARRRASQIQAELQTQVGHVMDQQVLAPVAVELERYADFVAEVARAL